eukprot:TRINITY_DN9276_c0_g1_i1.p2 TRINITY_DN9276_c0_g1~~TRINITY_DN9276_c0_g1_i1.p2  ORF type:complete len:163 (-),score=37.50 TRINITY_DN9276_c0_g1_i1:153-641(-)
MCRFKCGIQPGKRNTEQCQQRKSWYEISHYRKSVGALVVYDVTKRVTFENVIKWVKELKANAEPDITITLVGNKIDICDEDAETRQVTRDEGERLADEQGAEFKETSAVANINVKAAFEGLIESSSAFTVGIYERTQGGMSGGGPIGEKLGRASASSSGCGC